MLRNSSYKALVANQCSYKNDMDKVIVNFFLGTLQRSFMEFQRDGTRMRFRITKASLVFY
jgi:hypothetical protein